MLNIFNEQGTVFYFERHQFLVGFGYYGNRRCSKCDRYVLKEAVHLDACSSFNLVRERCGETYKADGDVFHEFRDFGSIVYDQRVLSFKGMYALTLRDSFPLGAENVNIRFTLLQIWKQKKFSGSSMVGGFQER